MTSRTAIAALLVAWAVFAGEAWILLSRLELDWGTAWLMLAAAVAPVLILALLPCYFGLLVKLDELAFPLEAPGPIGSDPLQVRKPEPLIRQHRP
ncbi:MAG: hypothetical protein FJX60_23795 [Alphaproteobacteria bacterium]|nr:hypothetical protein [Alphaproteobacteria bacterium]